MKDNIFTHKVCAWVTKVCKHTWQKLECAENMRRNGDKMKKKRSTIKDVAALAGVSISVVSYVLNNTPGRTVTYETKQRILNAANELEYAPDSIARGMRTKRTMALGLVSFWKVNTPVFIDILDGVTNMAGQNGYRIVLCGLYKGQNEFEYADLYRARSLDGIILVSPPDGFREAFDEMKHINMIKKYNIPSVIINGYTLVEDINYIYIDYYEAAYLATKKLIELGHRKIAYLLPEKSQICSIWSEQRLKGYLDALIHNGIQDSYDIYNFEEMEELLDKIKERKGPTGVVINKSNYAHAFFVSAFERNINIPGEVSIIAANTEPYNDYMIPPITSIELPLYNMGSQAVKTLMDKIKGEANGLKIKLPNSIKEGKSCKKV